MDTFDRTTLGTFAAVGTFFRINVSAVVFDGDRTEFAGTLALFTSDTAVGADLAGIRAFVLAHAGDIGGLASWQHLQDAVRAGFCTGATTDAHILIDLGNVVNDMDGVVFTGVGAVLLPGRSLVPHSP